MSQANDVRKPGCLDWMASAVEFSKPAHMVFTHAGVVLGQPIMCHYRGLQVEIGIEMRAL